MLLLCGPLGGCLAGAAKKYSCLEIVMADLYLMLYLNEEFRGAGAGEHVSVHRLSKSKNLMCPEGSVKLG